VGDLGETPWAWYSNVFGLMRADLARGQVHIFAVNHGRTGDSIEIFWHRLGSDSLTLVKSVRHGRIKTANGVAATGPL
jgi:hypothetical protein